MFVKLFDEGEQQGDFSAVEKFSVQYEGNFTKDAPSVIKTHMLLQRHPAQENADVWLFTTAKDKSKSASLSQLKDQGYNIKFVQEGPSLGKLGHYMAFKYQDIFDLTNEQIEGIVEFMRYWEILRKCCGMQMSSDWRQELLPPNKKGPRYNVHHDQNSPSYPACQIYDIDNVESLLVNTKLAKTMSAYPKLGEIIRPSTVDGPLNGNYCSRYNRAVKEHGIGFNERIPVVGKGKN